MDNRAASWTVSAGTWGSHEHKQDMTTIPALVQRSMLKTASLAGVLQPVRCLSAGTDEKGAGTRAEPCRSLLSVVRQAELHICCTCSATQGWLAIRLPSHLSERLGAAALVVIFEEPTVLHMHRVEGGQQLCPHRHTRRCRKGRRMSGCANVQSIPQGNLQGEQHGAL